MSCTHKRGNCRADYSTFSFETPVGVAVIALAYDFDVKNVACNGVYDSVLIDAARRKG